MGISPKILLSPTSFAVVLGLVVLVYIAASVAFMYHWKAYGMNTGFIKAAPAIYFSFSLFLIASAIVSFLNI